MAARASTAKGDSSRRRNRREEVLEAAVHVFHEKGYGSATIQDVADRVGVLKGSLYHYIDSKEDLLARIFDESDAEAFALIDEVSALDAPALERLWSFARAWSLWYMKNTERAAVYQLEWKHLTGARSKKALKTRHRFEARVRDLIEDVKANGDAAPNLDSRYACFFLLSAIGGLSTWYRRRGTDSAAHIADTYAAMVVRMVSESSAAVDFSAA